LNESFILGGYNFIKIKYLDGFHVLLLGEYELKVKEVVEEKKEWFDDLFDTIVPWEDQFVVVDKLVWVRCRGLPLILWNVDCFGKNAALLGNLVEVDKATQELEELEYARFMIRVHVGCEVKLSSYFKINRILYQVFLVEECTVSKHHLYQGHWDGKSVEQFSYIESQASFVSGECGIGDGEYVYSGGREELCGSIVGWCS